MNPTAPSHRSVAREKGSRWGRSFRLFGRRCGAGFGFAATLVGLTTLTSACSVGLFDQNPSDPALLNRTPYRKASIACSGINLSSSTVDVSTVRKLVGCFNAHGGLQALAGLLQALPDQKVQPLIDVGNRHLFQDERRLFQVETAYNALAANGTLNPLMEQLGRILENEELVASGISLLKQVASDTRSRTADSAYRIHPDLLVALRKLSTRVNAKQVGDLLDAGLMIAQSEAGQLLYDRLSAENRSGRDLEKDFVAPLSRLLTDPSELAQSFGRRPLELLAQGKLFQWVDDLDVVGSSSEAIRDHVPRMAMLLRTMGGSGRAGFLSARRDARLLDDLTSLFHAARAPLRCLKGEKEVKDAAVFLVREMQTKSGAELQEFLIRSNPILLSVMNSACSLPQELGDLYGVISQLASEPAIFPATDLIKAAVRKGIDGWLIDLLSYTRSEADGQPAGAKLLLPIVAEMTDRELWDDVLYLATSPTDSQRASIAEAAQFLLEPMPEADGKSLFDIGREMLGRASVVDLYRFVKAGTELFKANRILFGPSLSALRDGLQTTDAHPFLDLAKAIMADPKGHETLYATLIEVADSPVYRETFRSTIRLAAELAQNGQLKELMGSVLSLFHRFAQKGSYPIAQTSPVPFQAQARHSWSSRSVLPRQPSDFPMPAPLDRAGVAACRALDLNLSFDDTKNAGWNQHVGNVLACLSLKSDFDSTADSIRYLLSQRTTTQQNYLEFQIGLLKKFAGELENEQIRDLADRWIRSVHDLSFFRGLEGFSLLTNATFAGAKERGPGGAVLEPLVDVASSLYLHPQTRVSGLMNFAAQVIERPDLPRTLRYLDDLSSFKDACKQARSDGREDPLCSGGSTEPFVNRFDRARIARWVNNRECVRNEAQRNQRVDQIIRDSEVGADSWSLDPATGQSPIQNTREKWHELLDPVLAKIGERSASSSKKSITQAVVNAMRYFSLPPREGQPAGPAPAHATDLAHYSPDYFLQWLRERSDDYRLISYFYPGQKSPRVRLVNGIEILELVLVNADLKYLFPDNFGYKFLSMLGESWGDEVSARWPQEVRARYPRRAECDSLRAAGKTRERLKLVRGGDCPRTIEETFRNDDAFPGLNPIKSIQGTLQMFEAMVGYPDLPSCPQVRDPANPSMDSPNPVAPTGGAPDFMIPDYVRAAVFNLHQLLPVVEESLPGAAHPTAGGLRVLRDLFYELHTSSPERCQDARSGECNNLSILVRLVKLGMGRQGGRAIRSFPSLSGSTSESPLSDRRNREQLLGVSRALVGVVLTPEFSKIAEEILGTPSGRTLAWGMMDQVFDILESATPSTLPVARRRELLAQSESERIETLRRWARESAQLGSIAYHAAGLIQRWDLIPQLMSSLLPVLRTHQEYLVGRTDLLRVAVEEEWILDWLQALHDQHVLDSVSPDEAGAARGAVAAQSGIQEILKSALTYKVADKPLAEVGIWSLRVILPSGGENASWEQFVGRWKSLRKDPRFEALRWSALMNDLLQFFEERQEDRPSGVATRIRTFVAARLKSGRGGAPGDVEELVRLLALNKAEFWKLLSNLGYHARRGGELSELTELVVRSLESVRR